MFPQKHTTLADVNIVIVAFSESYAVGGKLSKYQINSKSKDLFIALFRICFFKMTKANISSVKKKTKLSHTDSLWYDFSEL